jgi:hypothetical protein
LVRPWITPEEVKEYSTSDKVKQRADQQLKADIMRAESYVIYHTHNRFDDEQYDSGIPEDVAMAVTLLAEAYALKSINQVNGVMSSETFDDYSYTMDTDTDLVDSLQLGPMLDPYVLTDNGKVIARLRKL